VASGFKKPYANFPDSGSVLQSLRPFPQYSGVGQFQARQEGVLSGYKKGRTRQIWSLSEIAIEGGTAEKICGTEL
jgi:hypothetical protein